MRAILLTQEKIALVDDEYYEYLNQWKWFASLDRKNGNWYAKRNAGKWPHQMAVRMHRAIMQAPEGMEVDHIDGDGLNNQSENLRLCTHAGNIQNEKLRKNNSSGYKGVCWNKKYSNWSAQIEANCHNYFLGYFTDPVEAAKIYDEAAKKYHGEFANTNFS